MITKMRAILVLTVKAHPSVVVWRVVLGGLIIAGAGACSSEEDVNLAMMNFHALEEGKAYRSAQPREDELRYMVDKYGIRTVINLRGENTGKSWYDTEAAVCHDENVVLKDIRMSSQSLPSPEVLAELVEALRTAERPILLHCQSGADRSGLAAAMYRLVVEGRSKEEALRELDGRYGHFRGRKPCMTKLIEIYEPTEEWLEEYEQTYNEIDCREQERDGEETR